MRNENANDKGGSGKDGTGRSWSKVYSDEHILNTAMKITLAAAERGPCPCGCGERIGQARAAGLLADPAVAAEADNILSGERGAIVSIPFGPARDGVKMAHRSQDRTPDEQQATGQPQRQG